MQKLVFVLQFREDMGREEARRNWNTGLSALFPTPWRAGAVIMLPRRGGCLRGCAIVTSGDVRRIAKGADECVQHSR